MKRHLVLSGGPGHDFDATSTVLVKLLSGDGIESVVVTEPGEALAMLRESESNHRPSIDLLTVNTLRWRMEIDRYEPLRVEYGFAVTDEEVALVDRYVRSGGGLLALHAAVICFDAHPAWRRLCGASWNWARSSHPPLGLAKVGVTLSGRSHPLTEGIDDFLIRDEIYGFLDEDDDIDPLLAGAHGGREHPLLWARKVGQGRVVTDVLGHGVESLSHPSHHTILSRVASWAIRRVPRSD